MVTVAVHWLVLARPAELLAIKKDVLQRALQDFTLQFPNLINGSLIMQPTRFLLMKNGKITQFLIDMKFLFNWYAFKPFGIAICKSFFYLPACALGNLALVYHASKVFFKLAEPVFSFWCFYRKAFQSMK